MRITPGIQRARAVADMQRASTRHADLARMISTGERYNRASQDPLYASDILAATRALSELGQASRSQGAARARLETEDSVLSSITDILTRAKELAFAMGDDGATPENRLAAQVEINQMIDQAMSLANTRIGNEYVFSGQYPDVAPYNGAVYVGGDIPRMLEILPGQRIVASQTARQLFEDSGVMSSMVALRDALGTGQAPAVRDTIAGLDDAMTATERNLAESGARLRRVEVAEVALAEQEALLLARKDQSGGVQAEEVLAEFLANETALQMSAASLNRILSMNLVQYLS